VLSNRDQSLSKIGLTRTGTPDARADDYSRQHGIQWHVYWSARTLNVTAAEAGAHRALQDRRFALVPEAREIFHTTPENARRIAARYVVAPDGEAQTTPLRRPAWALAAERAATLLIAALAAWRLLRHFQRQLRTVLRALS
jgi:hypothetical protein